LDKLESDASSYGFEGMPEMSDSNTASANGPEVFPTQRVNKVYMDRPWQWLAAGWKDYIASMGVGIPYGLLFAVTGAVLCYIVWTYEIFYLTWPLAAGFLLIGPLLAVGLYDTSRRLEKNQSVSLGDALMAFRHNAPQIGLMGVILLVINLAWVRFASLLFLLYFSDAPPPPEVVPFINAFLSVDAIPFLIIGNAIGAVFAFVTFAVSAISIPMLLERNVNVVVAIATSVEAVRQNFKTMVLWAFLVALFIGAGIATAFVGLIVTLPLVGHATWHAYKELVPPKEED
jgi:uncharacterized membrane protein